MEVVAVKYADLRILQRERIVPRRNDDVLADLRRVRENARKAVEHALAELDRIVPPAAGGEVRDDVVAEIRSEYECIPVTLANKHIVAARAGQRVAPVRADDRLARARGNRVATAVDLLGLEGVHPAVQLRRSVAPRAIATDLNRADNVVAIVELDVAEGVAGALDRGGVV